MSNIDSRAREAAMLNRCVFVARSESSHVSASSGREANVFRVAAMVIQSRFAAESKALMACADRYFTTHPDALRPAIEVIRNGDVISLPRLRDSLSHRFRVAESM